MLVSKMRHVAFGFLLFSVAGSQAAFSKLIVFGDSLSDQGNVSASTFGFTPGGNYFQGRWSNGNVWAERFATTQGLTLTRRGAGGSNWAHGGAETGTGTFGSILFLPNMRTQVTRYLNTSPTIASTDLFTLWAGGNDYLNGATSPTNPVGNVTSSISTLYARGARKFLIPNLPLLGTIPRNIGTPNQAAATAISAAHNALLKQQLISLRNSLTGITIYEMDVATRFEQVRQNPGAFGLTNVTQPALVGSSVVPNPDNYLFYDDIHPTRRGHQILSDLAVQSVPEPASMTALALGIATILRKKRASKPSNP
jgi:phospholipase/lecithinase/hemolysin